METTVFMRRAATFLLLPGVALAVLTLVVGAMWAPRAGAAGEPVIGIDAQPATNTPTSLGPVDSCVSVASGDIFDIDITITDVTELLAWEVYLAYEPGTLKVMRVNVEMFQAANDNSNVFNASDPLPDRDGLYRITAADLGEPNAADSGSGVLARLTLEASLPGVHTISVDPIDRNEDGKPDIGPTLTDDAGDHPGDSDGDGFFDGTISNAEVAVDSECAGGASGVGSLSEIASDTGGTLWWIAALIGGGIAAALAVGAIVWTVRRRRPSQA